mmetsp:Transcript_34342/g.82729  ORF Transcript_34342/g.82729 Transcript_34342/m.82729 type:complete len:456 (+) Transcript_34342:185-1552(+)
MPKRTAVSSSSDEPPPFVPLEETMMVDTKAEGTTNSFSSNNNTWNGRRTPRTMNWEAVDGRNARHSNSSNHSDGDSDDDDYDDDYDAAGGGISNSSSHSSSKGHHHPSSASKSKKTTGFQNATSAGAASVSTGYIAVSQLPHRMLSSLPCPKIDMKKLIMSLLMGMFVTIIYQSFFVAPQDRIIQPDFSDRFLDWVETNPVRGLGAILVVIAAAVVSMVPIGTPLVLGCGFIYRGVYGWKLGLFVSTAVSMIGSTLGAVICFLLGRYLMRDTVKRWVRNYPLFDAIDVAASENGLKIMAMLYLTPVLPLGLVSYMCGTTSLKLFDFAAAKIASLPLYLIYTFIGASAHSFIKRGGDNAESGGSIGASVADEAKKLEENQFILISGLVLSISMMTLITRYIRKELMKILDQQKKEKTESQPLISVDDGNDTAIEMGLTSRRKGTHSKSTNKRIPVV